MCPVILMHTTKFSLFSELNNYFSYQFFFYPADDCRIFNRFVVQRLVHLHIALWNEWEKKSFRNYYYWVLHTLMLYVFLMVKSVHARCLLTGYSRTKNIIRRKWLASSHVIGIMYYTWFNVTTRKTKKKKYLLRPQANSFKCQ